MSNIPTENNLTFSTVYQLLNLKHPTTTQYLESLSNPSQLLSTLKGLKLATTSAGDPIISSGNFGTVFKITIGRKTHALKCFTRFQPLRSQAYNLISKSLTPHLPYIVNYRYLNNEIATFDAGNISRFPVLLMDWVEGDTMTRHLRRAVINRNKEALTTLNHKFNELCYWLLSTPIAHGDLKPDNIMVRPNGDLTLVDYDGIYTPEMIDMPQRELGTPEFQHPLRQNMKFNKAIDHYSIAVISATLQLLAEMDEYTLQHYITNGTLFNPQNILTNCDAFYNRITQTKWKTSPVIQALTSPIPIISNIADLIDPNSTTKPAIVENNPKIFIPFKENEQFGFINKHNQIAIKPQFESVSEFSEEMAAVKIRGRWGYISTDGMVRIPPIYNYAGPMSEGFAVVSISGKFGYIDPSGRNITGMKFNNAWSFREQRGLIRKGNKYGFVDPEGKLAISAKFDFAHSFNEGVACVMVDQKYGYINKLGKWIIKPQFTFAQSVRNGKAQVENGNEIITIEMPAQI